LFAPPAASVKHEYVRVVDAYRDRGKTRHRTVLNLGRKDLLAAHLDLAKLMRLLHGEAVPEGAIRARGRPRHGGVGLGTDAGGTLSMGWTWA